MRMSGKSSILKVFAHKPTKVMGIKSLYCVCAQNYHIAEMLQASIAMHKMDA